MKKILFGFLLLVGIPTVYGQVAVTVSPKYGCPNTTHNVSVTVTNNTASSIPAGIAYTVTVTIQTAAPATTIGTFSQSYSDGFGTGAANKKTFVVLGVAFVGPMICDVSGTLTVPAASLSYPYTTTYTVQYPPIPTLTESPTGTVALQTPFDGYTVQYFKDADYGSVYDFSSSVTTYTPTASGTYTAKFMDPANNCFSTGPSNGVPITVASTDVKDGQNVNIKVYPNPMASTVTISTTLSNKLSYELADINGTVLRSAEFTSATNVNTENLKSGNYILTVKDNHEKVASYKLVK